MRSALFALALALPTGAYAQSHPDARAIVAIGGPVTETIFALGEGARVIARDTTSLYPEAVTRDTAGPPETLDQLRAASVPVVSIHDSFTKEAVLDNVTAIGAAIGAEDAAAALHAKIAAQFAHLEASLAEQTDHASCLSSRTKPDGSTSPVHRPAQTGSSRWRAEKTSWPLRSTATRSWVTKP